MKKETVKKVKKSILVSHVITVLVMAIVVWVSLFYLFSNPSILKDVAKVLNDGTSNALEITWGVFWIILPIIILIQFGCSIISLATLDDKKEVKDKKVKSKRKKK